MFRPRVIPCLLLQKGGLVKTVRFKSPTYIGDPINAVKIFNDKEVDELLFLDIAASVEDRAPNIDYLRSVCSECFMPLAYGGGIKTLEQVKAILAAGVEKVVLNSIAAEDSSFVKRVSECVGSQAVVVAVDVKKSFFGKYQVVIRSATKSTGCDPVSFALNAARAGAGELLLTSVDREGTMMGYDIELLKRVSSAVDIPVVANGGAGTTAHFADAVRAGGASAVAAGSMFVFHGKHRAVLINFPTAQQLDATFAGSVQPIAA